MIRINRPKFHVSGYNKFKTEVYSDDHKHDKEIERMANEHGAKKIRIVTSYESDLARKKVIIHDIIFNDIKEKELFENNVVCIGEELKEAK